MLQITITPFHSPITDREINDAFFSRSLVRARSSVIPSSRLGMRFRISHASSKHSSAETFFNGSLMSSTRMPPMKSDGQSWPRQGNGC